MTKKHPYASLFFNFLADWMKNKSFQFPLTSKCEIVFSCRQSHNHTIQYSTCTK